MANYKRLDNIGVDYVIRKVKALLNLKEEKSLVFENVNVPITGWGTEASNFTLSENYKFYYDIILNNVTDFMFADVTPSFNTSEMNILASHCQTFNGKLRIFANSIPIAPLTLIRVEFKKG